jgi:very-short-patch-repair endonuclease
MAYSADNRFNYLVKTLSRTKRKDYENYVINAVWNKLNDRTVKPASQWYVKSLNGWHLIDLYFPQINFGVECDEGHHKHSQEADKERELTLIEVLSIDNRHPYKAFHIDVTLPYEEIELKIDECVREIQELVIERRKANDFIDWVSFDLEKYFQDIQIIRSSDDIIFPSIVAAVNALMRSDAKAYMMGYFTPKGLDPEYKFWFPQIEIEGKAQAYGWHNTLSDDGTTITEYNDNIKENLSTWERSSTQEFLDYTRVVFAKVHNPVTRQRAYKFVGVFKLQDINSSDVRTYVKIADVFDVGSHRVTS